MKNGTFRHYWEVVSVALLALTLAACNLEVELAGDGGGEVVSDDGKINCPLVRCAYNYENNTVVTLTATAASGYHFNGYKNPGLCSNGIADSFATGMCIIRTSANHKVTAIFIGVDDICPNDPDENCLENTDGDFDGDGLKNGADLCPTDPTNACDDFDTDGDGIRNGDDLCINDASNNCLENPDGDFDGDGKNNAADVCPSDKDDNCPAAGANFSDNFNDNEGNAYSGWTEVNFIDGEKPLYTEVNGRLEWFRGPDEDDHVTLNNATLTGQNLTLSVDVTAYDNVGSFYIYFFYKNPNNWYRLGVNDGANSLFQKRINGTITNLGELGLGNNINNGSPMRTWRVEVKSSGSLEFFVNDTSNLRVTESFSLNGGKVGLGGQARRPVWDNFSVSDAR